jgi:hypothetical protein
MHALSDAVGLRGVRGRPLRVDAVFVVPLSGSRGSELATPVGADGQETVAMTVLSRFSPSLVLFESREDGVVVPVRVDLEPDEAARVIHHHMLVEAIADRATQVGVYELKWCAGSVSGWGERLAVRLANVAAVTGDRTARNRVVTKGGGDGLAIDTCAHSFVEQKAYRLCAEMGEPLVP